MPPQQNRRAARGRGEIILMVEDDDGVRDYVRKLRGLGYKVFEAGEAESALRLLDDKRSSAFDRCRHARPERPRACRRGEAAGPTRKSSI